MEKLNEMIVDKLKEKIEEYEGFLAEYNSEKMETQEEIDKLLEIDPLTEELKGEIRALKDIKQESQYCFDEYVDKIDLLESTIKLVEEWDNE